MSFTPEEAAEIARCKRRIEEISGAADKRARTADKRARTAAEFAEGVWNEAVLEANAFFGVESSWLTTFCDTRKSAHARFASRLGGWRHDVPVVAVRSGKVELVQLLGSSGFPRHKWTFCDSLFPLERVALVWAIGLTVRGTTPQMTDIPWLEVPLEEGATATVCWFDDLARRHRDHEKQLCAVTARVLGGEAVVRAVAFLMDSPEALVLSLSLAQPGEDHARVGDSTPRDQALHRICKTDGSTARHLWVHETTPADAAREHVAPMLVGLCNMDVERDDYDDFKIYHTGSM